MLSQVTEKLMKKLNKFNFKAFEDTKNTIEQSFPKNLRKGFYIKDFSESSIVNNPKLRTLAVSGVAEIREDNVNFRIYRRADSGTHLYDVDEIGRINKRLKEVKHPIDIRNHHLNKRISEDIMERNNLTFEAIEDSNGNIKLNTDSKGMVKTFINFEDKIK